MSTSTSTSGACTAKLAKRAAPPAVSRVAKKWGEDEVSKEDCTRTHITITDENVGWYTSKFGMTCPGKDAPQACYHYRWVLEPDYGYMITPSSI
jgi:hypothetical protein